MKEEKTFQEQMSDRFVLLPRGPYKVIPLLGFLHMLKREELRMNADLKANTFRNRGLSDDWTMSVGHTHVAERVVDLKMVATTMTEHLLNSARSEVENIGGFKWETDKELEAIFVEQDHRFAFENGTSGYIVKFPTGQFMFANPEDWIILTGMIPDTFMERAAIAVCIPEKRSRQLFLPFKS